MILKEVIPLFPGDVVRLRKQHPCGSYEWLIVRTGVDTGLRCLKCNRRIMLPRMTTEKRIKAFISRGPEAPDSDLPRTGRELLATGAALMDLQN
ncbi:MAG: DUF951 domain-containing protein [Thermomicrobiales bacterium]